VTVWICELELRSEIREVRIVRDSQILDQLVDDPFFLFFFFSSLHFRHVSVLFVLLLLRAMGPIQAWFKI